MTDSTIALIERLKNRAKFDTAESPYRLMSDAATELTTLLERQALINQNFIDEIEGLRQERKQLIQRCEKAEKALEAYERERMSHVFEEMTKNRDGKW